MRGQRNSLPEQVKIGSVTIGAVPRIVASIGEGNIMHLAKKAKTLGADIIELRLDRMKNINEFEDIFSCVRKVTKLPIISTIRWHKELGKTQGSFLQERKRRDLFSRVIPLTDAVDIEINSRIFSSVAREARRMKKTVIASYHNFKIIPPDGQLRSLVRKGFSNGGHIVKIAAYARTLREAGRFLCFCIPYRPGRVAAVAMGEAGKLARYAAPLCGSALLYGYIDRPYGPGQLKVSEIKESLQP